MKIKFLFELMVAGELDEWGGKVMVDWTWGPVTKIDGLFMKTEKEKSETEMERMKKRTEARGIICAEHLVDLKAVELDVDS